MKLGTLKNSESLDGTPVLVNCDGTKAVKVSNTIPCWRVALEKWNEVSPQLEKTYKDLNAGDCANAFDVNEEDFHSPLPRAFQWVDGSVYLHHMKLVRQARGAEMPPDFYETPLVYQGGSDNFLAPREDIPLVNPAHGLDFEAEVCVITDFVPMGTQAEEALKYIKLILICNDVSLRGLIPAELGRGFGFYQSKPSSSFSPFAITPDELGDSWKNGTVHHPLLTDYNGEFFGKPDAAKMNFHFGKIIEHACLTRNLGHGTIVGSGTVSNDDTSVGSSCLAEKRMIEKIETGEFKTPFMKDGDTVEIRMLDKNQKNIFGTILQKVQQI